MSVDVFVCWFHEIDLVNGISGNIGFNLANPSILAERLGYSSVSNTMGSPFRCGRITGTISSTNLCVSIAAIAFF